MSYDVYVGGAEEGFNYTFNLAKLFYEHIPDNGKGGGLRELHNTLNAEVVIIMSVFFKNVQDEYHSLGKEEMRKHYDAANGWGSFDGALIFAARILGEAAINPTGTTEVSM